MTIKNASRLPEVYYGLHMVPGVAEYRDPGVEPYRIYLNEVTTKAMDPSFKGKPVYVQHVDQVDVQNLQQTADGYVTKSFFNQADGMHWCEFIIVSDAGHEAIAKGWKLSNAYIVKAKLAGGLCNGVEYREQVTSGEFEHLAIVPNPRYEQSRVLTPEQFKTYNSEKELELKRLSNSKDQTTKGATAMKFNFFKKEKVENSAELEGMSVTLPKSKKEITLEKLINDMDEMGMSGGYANGDHKVKVGEEEMTVNDLVEKHLALMKAVPAEEASPEDKFEMKNDEDNKKPAPEKEVAKADDDKEEEIEEGEKEKDAEKKKNALAAYHEIMNAGPTFKNSAPALELSQDQVARGKKRYGSN